MTTKHTPGPWNFEMVDVALGEIKHGVIAAKREATDYCKANPRIAIVDHIECGEGAANAARIVACVNACRGLNPEAVPELVKALKKVLHIMEMYHKEGIPENAGHEDACELPENCGHCLAVKSARAAITLAEAPQ